jgi:hypothetical protein
MFLGPFLSNLAIQSNQFAKSDGLDGIEEKVAWYARCTCHRKASPFAHLRCTWCFTWWPGLLGPVRGQRMCSCLSSHWTHSEPLPASSSHFRSVWVSSLIFFRMNPDNRALMCFALADLTSESPPLQRNRTHWTHRLRSWTGRVGPLQRAASLAASSCYPEFHRLAWAVSLRPLLWVLAVNSESVMERGTILNS